MRRITLRVVPGTHGTNTTWLALLGLAGTITLSRIAIGAPTFGRPLARWSVPTAACPLDPLRPDGEDVGGQPRWLVNIVPLPLLVLRSCSCGRLKLGPLGRVAGHTVMLLGQRWTPTAMGSQRGSGGDCNDASRHQQAPLTTATASTRTATGATFSRPNRTRWSASQLPRTQTNPVTWS